LSSKPCLPFDESLDFIGTKAKTLPRQFHLLQLTAPRHRVNRLNFEAEHCGDLFRFEQSILLTFPHMCYYTGAFIFLSRELSELEGKMARCPRCGGYLTYEPEFLETPARVKCITCAWMLYDPNFRKEERRYFPTDSVDRRIEWRQQHPGFDLLSNERGGGLSDGAPQFSDQPLRARSPLQP
jgi:hypothetical protein